MKNFFHTLNYDSIYFISILFIIAYYVYAFFPYVTIFLVIFCLYKFLNRKECFLYALLFFLFLIPMYSDAEPMCSTARIIEVKKNYVICKNNNSKFIIYTDDNQYFDSIIEVNGNFKRIDSEYGFYRFQADDYYEKQGIYYSLEQENIEVVQQLPTLRYFIQKRIDSFGNKEIKDFLYMHLINVGRDDDSHFNFSYAGILFVLDDLLSYVLMKKKRNKVIFIITILLCILYRFPLILFRNLLKQIFDKTQLRYKDKTGFILLILLFIYRYQFYTYGNLIYLLFVYMTDEKMKLTKRWLYLSILQSLIFNEINIVQIMLYGFFLRSRVFIYFYSWIIFIFPFLYLNTIDSFLSYLSNCLNKTILYGSLIGFGLILFLIVVSYLKEFKYKYAYIFLLLICFQYFGLFHPLGEVTFINVGQGDCILIRESLNRNNILIDTGKSSSYRYVKDYLHAKGIKKIHTLFISHHDEDHDGNMQLIVDDYKANVIDNHFKEMNIKDITFYDLNDINSEDLNQSSQVLYTNINGLSYLLMGDADIECEQYILNKYDLNDIHILKLGHHGSKTSTSDLFLDITQPKLAVISCGNYAIYHHPDPSILEKLQIRKIPFLTTKQTGDISIMQWFYLNILITSKHQYSLFLR